MTSVGIPPPHQVPNGFPAGDVEFDLGCDVESSPSWWSWGASMSMLRFYVIG